MTRENRSWIERVFAFIDKYPLKTLLMLFFLIMLSFTIPPALAIWEGKDAKVQLAALEIYKELFLNHCCLPLIITLMLIAIGVFLFNEQRKAYKKEIHRISREKAFLQMLLTNSRFPPSGNREV